MVGGALGEKPDMSLKQNSPCPIAPVDQDQASYRNRSKYENFSG